MNPSCYCAWVFGLITFAVLASAGHQSRGAGIEASTRVHAGPLSLEFINVSPTAAQRTFDARFGAEFFDTLWAGAGVYEFVDAAGASVYVGKARELPNRLRQYRNATRLKAHRKMRKIVQAAASIRIRPCDTELQALLLENQLIQSLRPPFNVSGAFSFLYPAIGLRTNDRDIDLCCTSSPEALTAFSFTGSYRSPALTRRAFAALIELLDFIAHREPSRRVTDVPKVAYTRVVRFRQLRSTWLPHLNQFLNGRSDVLLKELVLALLESQQARRRTGEIQANLELLRHFWAYECVPLRQTIEALGGTETTFLPQRERDPAFLSAKHAARSSGRTS